MAAYREESLEEFFERVPPYMLGNFTVNGEVPTRRVLLGLVDSETEEMTDEDWDAISRELEMERKLDVEYTLQDKIETTDELAPTSTRFTIHETWRWSWLGLDGTLYSELRVGRRVNGNYHAQSRREMRRERGDQARSGSFRNHGRKPQRKHRDRRPEMRDTLQKLFRETELNRLDPIELAQMNLDENGEFDADLEAERAYDERFPLPKPPIVQPTDEEIWLFI